MASAKTAKETSQLLNIKSTFTTTLDLPPSCILDIPRPYIDSPNLLLIGTYHLEKDEDLTETPNVC